MDEPIPRTSAGDGPADDPIDRAYLARFTLGNAALEREVLELFAEQAPHYLERLREAQTRTDWQHAAHTIKGSAAAVGARRVAGLAQKAEQIDFTVKGARSLVHRDEAVAALAAGIEEARGFIARLYAGPCPKRPSGEEPQRQA